MCMFMCPHDHYLACDGDVELAVRLVQEVDESLGLGHLRGYL